MNEDEQKVEIIDPSKLPYETIKLENVSIPMSDGSNLDAHIWIPKDALKLGLKVGTLVEYIPYRKDDFTSIRDTIRHPYYSGNGLCSIRIDMRGSGDSDGLLLDEYLEQEQNDALDSFDWIIRQPWSNGNIGMFGKSWGGFNALQIAARQHPSLKTCISLMSTDDRYSDDVHYRGGAMLASDMLWWGSTMLVYDTLPPDPVIVGEKWKESFLERLEIKPMVKNWLEHQTRDSYWKHGSVCEDYSKVDIPILCIGGWKDGYTSPVFRMAENLPHPESSGIVGPWVHEYPEKASPGPKIGYQQLSLSWFKKYLEPQHKSTFDLPRFTSFIQEPVSLKGAYSTRDGNWVSLSKVSLSNQKTKSLYFGTENDLSEHSINKNISNSIYGDLTHGSYRGNWCPFGLPGDFSSDQRIEDDKCLVFDSKTFEDDLVLHGQPVVKMIVSSDKRLATCSVRLVDINLDTNEHLLISWGMLNLTHRDSDEFPEYLTPGEKYEISVKLDVLGVKIVKGHRLRVALSTTDWPSFWPSPETPVLNLYKGELILPLIDQKSIISSPDFGEPSIMPPLEIEILKEENRVKRVIYDCITDSYSLEDIQDSGIVRLPKLGKVSGITFGECNYNSWKIEKNDPLSALNVCKWDITLGRGEWQIRIKSKSSLSADETQFKLFNEIIAYENDRTLFDKSWSDLIPRKFL